MLILIYEKKLIIKPKAKEIINIKDFFQLTIRLLWILNASRIIIWARSYKKKINLNDSIIDLTSIEDVY